MIRYVSYVELRVTNCIVLATCDKLFFSQCVGQNRIQRKEEKKKQFFSGEKMRNSGNCIYDYAHSFFRENFESKPLYWYLNIVDPSLLYYDIVIGPISTKI